MHTLLVNFHKKKSVSEIGGQCEESAVTPFFRLVPIPCRCSGGLSLASYCVAGLVRVRFVVDRVTECPGTSVFLCQCNFSSTPYLSSLSWCCYQGKRSDNWSLPTKTSFPEVENGWILLFALVVW